MMQYTCDECGFTAKNAGALASHKRYSHKEGEAMGDIIGIVSPNPTSSVG